MSLADWPEDERPREKLLKNGAGSLSTADLLAIQIRIGVRGKTVVELSRDLMKKYGSISALINADQKTFCEMPGLGVAKFVQLQAALELARRYMFETIASNDVITNPNQAKDYIVSHLKGRHSEVFACLFLDAQHRAIVFEELFHGTISSASVYPRIVLKQALKHNASGVMLAHNHPSGNSQPSPADKNITKVLKESLAIIDVQVVDHIIVGENDVLSFAERGLL